MNTEKLIELVKEHEMLYDLSHADYKNIRKKDAIWMQIGIHLKKDDVAVKNRWKNLKDNYSRYIRSLKTKTGQAAKNKKKWVWADQMSFLRPYIMFAKTESNVSDIEELDVGNDGQENVGNALLLDTATDHENRPSSSAINTDNLENSLPSPTSPTSLLQTTTALNNVSSESVNPVITGRSEKRLKRKEPPSSSVSEIIQYFNNKKKVEHDDIDSLFLAYAKTVKKFTAKRQAVTKLKVGQVIMEQEIQNLEDLSNVEDMNNVMNQSSRSGQDNINDFLRTYDPNS